MTAYLSIIAIKAHFRIHFDMTHWEDDDESFEILQDYKSKNKRNNKKRNLAVSVNNSPQKSDRSECPVVYYGQKQTET